MKSRVCLLVVIVIGAITSPILAQSDPILTVLTHDSFSVSEDVLSAFEEETGIQVRLLRVGDAGTMVNQAILSRENPLGDVLYGVDNTFLTRALEAELFIPYESPLLESVADPFLIDEEFRVTAINYGDVCLNYDVAYFSENELPLPESLADLTEPMYESLLVVENPASSSPGLAFLLATIAVFGQEPGDEGDEGEPYTYLDYWTDLVANDVLIVDDWTDAYYGEFSGSSDGLRPLVVSYASSPPAEVYFAEEELETPPTGSIVADETCFRQIEFAGILDGTANLDAAQQFMDFLLSVPFQEDVPLQMFVFPVNEEAELPEVFATYAQIPEAPITMSIDEIGENREEWIQSWVETVLR